MKRKVLISTMMVLLIASCGTNLSPELAGGLSLVVTDGASGTKSTASPDLTELPYEKAVNTLQVFIFEGQTLFKYQKLDLSSTELPFTVNYPDIKAGSYSIHVVANAPDIEDIATEDELAGREVALQQCRLEESEGFVMAGSVSVAVASGKTVTAEVPVRRFAARIRLVSVENKVPESYSGSGAIYVKGVFLANALGTWNMAGSGPATEWVNLGGRTAGHESSLTRSDFISSESQVNPSSCKKQVFRSIETTLDNKAVESFPDCCLYTFPNSVTVDHTGNTASAESGAFTRLVVLATVNGEDWWYPVTLFNGGAGPLRNSSSDVKLTITGTGSDDPNEPVGRGSVTASITVVSWESGTVYEEVI